ncbi:MAG TPA: hypothetical protein PK198_03565, partial [Saprospiraceae bacterium]|nr:hypothetical protein [Saprospiraceae bacterium]
MILLTVSEWWMAMQRPEQIFWIIAVVFTVLMLIQFILTLTGLDFDGDSDAGDLSHDGGLDHDHSFSVFSVRSIIAFFAFLGWTGVLMLGAGISLWLALLLGLLMGGIAMFLVAYLIFWFSRLGQEDNVTAHEAIYQAGDVYLAIPGGRSGIGRVTVKTRNVLREW